MDLEDGFWRGSVVSMNLGSDVFLLLGDTGDFEDYGRLSYWVRLIG